MLKRFTQIITLIILASYLFSDAAIAQTRRSKPRRSTRQSGARNKIQPLTESQKAVIAALIEEGKKVEYTFNYARSEFADSAMSMSSCKDVMALPDGNVKNFSSNLCQEYEDVGQVYGRITHTGLRNHIEETIKESHPDLDTLPLTIQRYGLQRTTPYEAVKVILNMAIRDRLVLEAVLQAAPTIPEPHNEVIEPFTTPFNTPNPILEPRNERTTNVTTPSPIPEQVSLSNPLIGTWLLKADVPNNQGIMVTLTVRQKNGKLDCIMGVTGDELPCTATGNSFTFTMPNVPIEGQSYNLDLAGNAEADIIKGNLTLTNSKGMSFSLPMVGRHVQ